MWKTKLFWANFIIFQWFFIRLFICKDKCNLDKVIGWGFLGLVCPFTGWWSNYYGTPSWLWGSPGTKVKESA